MKHIHTFESFLSESYSGPVGVELKDYKYNGVDEFLTVTLDNVEHRLLMERKFPRQATEKDIMAWESLEKELKKLKFPTQLQYTDDLAFAKQAIILNGFYEVYEADRERYTLVQTVDKHKLEFNTNGRPLKVGKVTYSSDSPD